MSGGARDPPQAGSGPTEPAAGARDCQIKPIIWLASEPCRSRRERPPGCRDQAAKKARPSRQLAATVAGSKTKPPEAFVLFADVGQSSLAAAAIAQWLRKLATAKAQMASLLAICGRR